MGISNGQFFAAAVDHSVQTAIQMKLHQVMQPPIAPSPSNIAHHQEVASGASSTSSGLPCIYYDLIQRSSQCQQTTTNGYFKESPQSVRKHKIHTWNPANNVMLISLFPLLATRPFSTTVAILLFLVGRRLVFRVQLTRLRYCTIIQLS